VAPEPLAAIAGRSPVMRDSCPHEAGGYDVDVSVAVSRWSSPRPRPVRARVGRRGWRPSDGPEHCRCRSWPSRHDEPPPARPAPPTRPTGRSGGCWRSRWTARLCAAIRDVLRRLGLGRPGGRALAAAMAVSGPRPARVPRDGCRERNRDPPASQPAVAADRRPRVPRPSRGARLAGLRVPRWCTPRSTPSSSSSSRQPRCRPTRC
jgi:hypothetical protein